MCWVLLLVMLLLPPTAPADRDGRSKASATQPSDPEQERLSELARIEAESALLPRLDVDSVQRAVRFSVEDDMLVARTELNPDQGQARVFAPGLKGVVRLIIYPTQAQQPPPQGQGAGGEPVIRNFQVIQQDLTDPRAGQVYTQISAVAGRVIVSRDAEGDQFESSVQLIQDPPPAPGTMPEEAPVRLLVQMNDADLKVTAASFAELRRKHPREVDRYLRPIFRDLHQEDAVFGVDPRIAWQVLGNDYRPDEQMMAKIRQLVARMDASDFQEREAAQQALKELGQPAAIALSRIDRNGLSLQQNSAVDAFLADFSQLPSAEAGRLGSSPEFLLDCLYSADRNIRKMALERLRKLAGRDLSFDLDAQGDAAALAVQKLRDQLAPSEPASRPASP